MYKTAALIILAFLQIFHLQAQDKKIFKQYFLEGEYYFFTEDYQEALLCYTKLLELDPDNHNVQYLLGTCYLNIAGQRTKALPYLRSALEGMTFNYKEGSYRERNAPYETLFGMGRALHINNEFDKAIRYYVEYRNVMGDGSYADYEYLSQQIEACERARAMMLNPQPVGYTDLGSTVNYSTRHYNPVMACADSVLIYMSDDPKQQAILYTKCVNGQWQEPEMLNEVLGSTGDCFITSISPDAGMLFLARTDNLNSDIYVSYNENGTWSKIKKLNKNINTVYYESHACISSDGKVIYFTSNRRGGVGALDIYRSEKDKKDDWGPATNLGPVINTMYNEDTPFITEDGKTLYFSSQGHSTMGGYDVFYSHLLSDGSWSMPESMGYPVNTADDDLFYVPLHNGENALYTALASGSNEQFNIYALGMISPEEAAMAAEKEEVTERVVEQTSPGTEKEYSKSLVIRSILFDYNDYSLNSEARKEVDNLYRIIKEFPDLTVAVTGHADAKGPADYNLELSKQRAESVMNYLVNKGIRKERIVSGGVGENENIAINQFPDGRDSPEGRQLNRHVKIELINFESEEITVEDIFVPEHLRPEYDLHFTVLLTETMERNAAIPASIQNAQITETKTDKAYLYTAGDYNRKADAVEILNYSIDHGFPDARLMERKELDRLIRSYTTLKPLGKRYTIQIMALKNPVETEYFSNLQGVIRYECTDGLYRYVIGEYDSVESALKKMPDIKALGYKDAFVMNLERYRKLTIK